MTFKLSLLAALIALASLSACGGGDKADEGTWTPFVYVGPTTLATTDTVVGGGAEATPGKTVRVLVTTWAYSATAPDFKGSQLDNGTAPAPPYTFTISIRPGEPDMDDAVVGMRVGGKRTAVIPGDMKVDPRPTSNNGLLGGVPKRAPVVSAIELLEVTTPASSS